MRSAAEGLLGAPSTLGTLGGLLRAWSDPPSTARQGPLHSPSPGSRGKVEEFSSP